MITKGSVKSDLLNSNQDLCYIFSYVRIIELSEAISSNYKQSIRFVRLSHRFFAKRIFFWQICSNTDSTKGSHRFKLGLSPKLLFIPTSLLLPSLMCLLQFCCTFLFKYLAVHFLFIYCVGLLQYYPANLFFVRGIFSGEFQPLFRLVLTTPIAFRSKEIILSSIFYLGTRQRKVKLQTAASWSSLNTESSLTK